jgi:hypothetical protein
MGAPPAPTQSVIGAVNQAMGWPAPQVATPAAMTMPASLPALGPIVGGLVAGAGSLLGGAVRVAAGLVRTAAGKIRGVMLGTGKFVSSKKAVDLAKRVGVDAAAVALGISAVEMAQMVLDEGTTKRRGRAITAAALRTTRRTMRQVQSMHRQIAGYCSSAGYRRAPRRSSGRNGGARVIPFGGATTIVK